VIYFFAKVKGIVLHLGKKFKNMTENNWKEEEEKIKQAFGDKTWAQIKSEESWRIFKIMSEFVEGIDKLSKIGPCVSIFGSARTSPESPYYKIAEEIAAKLVRHGYGVITGGGADGVPSGQSPGPLMHSVNHNWVYDRLRNSSLYAGENGI
jgi:hypothetical protein